jgi:Domain of unknown function (DUF5615)
VKILLDENIPESLAGALEDLGHEVDSVNSLKLKGIDNGTLYRRVAVDYGRVTRMETIGRSLPA